MLTEAASEVGDIYLRPDLYDRIVERGPCERFYSDLAAQADGPVLELACGTGRLTLPIAARRNIHGLDNSRPMLDVARAKAIRTLAEPSRARFMEADMRDFALPRRYGFAFVSCNSLAHLHSHEDIRCCFGCIGRSLRPGALLAFDIVNPNLAQLEGGRWLHVGPNPSAAAPVYETARYDRSSQIRTAIWTLDDPLAGSATWALRLRQIFPQELLAILDAAGLELLARFGDLARNPFTDGSLNQVCIARARTRCSPC